MGALSFEPWWKVRFIDRPNRFLVRAESAALGRIEAFMPNPGRMWELLLPNRTLYINKPKQTQENRKTAYTVLAVERDGAPVFLHTGVTNTVAETLLERGDVPGLEAARIVRREVTAGQSQFDFLLEDGRGPIYLEVKSCTLFGNRVAMFPDAITVRGRRHLLELSALAKTGVRAGVLFVVHTPKMRWFMPDYHTDPSFSNALLSVKDSIAVWPMSVRWTPRLRLGKAVRQLDVPWGYVEREATDRGAYLVLLEIPEAASIPVGKLGARRFAPGWYIYVGSAQANLEARMARHKRLRKKMHWHVDYLRAAARRVEVLPIRSSRRDECALAGALLQALGEGVAGFGSSDCRCASHCFHSPSFPLNRRDFHAILERFRLRPPE